MTPDVDRNALNMGRMLKRARIGPIALAFVNQGRLISSIVQTCQQCAVSEECQAWLMKSAAPVRHAPSFCPNRVNFDLANILI
jgi:hypothetical protein